MIISVTPCGFCEINHEISSKKHLMGEKYLKYGINILNKSQTQD